MIDNINEVAYEARKIAEALEALDEVTHSIMSLAAVLSALDGDYYAPRLSTIRAALTSERGVSEAIAAIRKSDCGAWLKECGGMFKCSDGSAKRRELAHLLDALYRAYRDAAPEPEEDK